MTGLNNTTETPEDYSLLQNYSNPFNPSTKIRFVVPEIFNVKLYLRDIFGSQIAVILDEEVSPGVKKNELNESNLASGVYFVRMVANNYQQTIKISLLK